MKKTIIIIIIALFVCLGLGGLFAGTLYNVHTDLKEENSILKINFDEKMSEFGSLLDDFDKQILAYEKEITENEKIVDGCKTEIVSLKSEISELEKSSHLALEEKNSMIEQKEQTINGLNSVVAELQAEIEQLESDYSQLLEQKNSIIAEKEQAISELNLQVAELQAEIEQVRNDSSLALEEKNSIIAEKEQTIEGLNSQVESLEAEIEQIENDNALALQEKDAIIFEKEGLISEKDNEINALNSTIETLEAEFIEMTNQHNEVVAEKNSIIAEKETLISNKETIIAEKEALITALVGQVNVLEAEVNFVLKELNNEDTSSDEIVGRIEELKNKLNSYADNNYSQGYEDGYQEGYNSGYQEGLHEIMYGTEGLVYTGLDVDGNITTDETQIVSYMIGDNSTNAGNGYLGTDTEVVIPKIHNGKPITVIGKNAFKNNILITSVIIPEYVASLGNSAFAGCSALVELTVNGPFTDSGMMSFVFSSCNIKTLNIGAKATELPSKIFSYCSNLTTINVDKNNTSFAVEDGVLFNYDKTIILRGEKDLTSIVVPDGVITIVDSAFYDLKSLTSLELSNSVTSIGSSAFSGCTALKSIIFSDGLTEIGASAFKGCTGLKSIVMPDSVTTLGTSVFNGCSGLSSVKISNKLITISHTTFSGCTGLTSIEIPDSVTTIDTSAFYGCTGLTSIIIPASVTTIGNQAFQNCSKLTEMTVYRKIPPTLSNTNAISTATKVINVLTESLSLYQTGTNWSNFASKFVGISESVESEGTIGLVYTGLDYEGEVETREEYIVSYVVGDYSVYDCNAYNGTETIIVIPEEHNGKPVTEITAMAFGNSDIKEIVIPSTITKIGSMGLGGGTTLEKLYIFAEEPPEIVSVNTIGLDLESSIIYVPSISLEIYKNHQFWGFFAELMVGF